MRRILNQAGNAAARAKEAIFEIVYCRLVCAWDMIKPSERLLTASVT